MKNKIIILIACLLGSMSLHAQEKICHHEITLGGGIGLTSLQYSLDQGSTSLGLGGNGSIGYNFFFNKHWGIGTGVEIAFYNQTVESSDLNGRYKMTNLVTSTPGDFYFNYQFQNFEETQNSTFVNIPLMLQYQTAGKHKFYVRGGVKLGIPISATYENKYESMTTSIYGEYEGNTYTNIPEEGLGTYEGGKSDGDLDFSLSFMASGELGVRWKLGEKWGLYTGIYADYGFNDISSGDNKEPLVARNDANYSEFKYNSATTSTEFSDKMAPFAVGLTVKLGFNPCCKKKEKPVKEEVIEVIPELAPTEGPVKPVEEEKPATPVEPAKPTEPATPVEPTPEPVKDTKGDDMKELATPISQYSTSTTTITTETQREQLDKKIELMKKYPEVKLNLEGHTCDIGSNATNIKVGMGRAKNAKKYMVQKGVNASRLTTTTKGEKKPIVPNNSLENRKKNRRVEFEVKK